MNVLSFIITARDQASQVFAKVKQTASGMQGMFSGIGARIAGGLAFGAVAAAAGGAARAAMEYAGRIKDATEATGMASDKFQALSIAARENGVGIDQLSTAVARLRNIQGSIGEDQSIQDTFRKLGMSIADVQAARPEEILSKIARGMKETGNAAPAFDIFGRSAASLLSTLRELEGGWDPLVAKMKGGILSQDDLEAVDALGDKLDTLGTRAKVSAATIVGAFSDAWSLMKRMGSGMSFDEAGMSLAGDKANTRKAKAADARQMQEAAAASALREKELRDVKALEAAKKEGAGLGDQYARAAMNEKDYAVRLEKQAMDLAAAANEEGLTALDRQTRMNEALRVAIELMSLQKKLQADANAERQREVEKANTETEAKRERLKAESQYKYRAKFEAATPEERLAMTEQNIKRWQGRVKSAGTEQEKLEATKGLIGQLEVRDQLKTDIKAAQDKAAADRQSAIDKEREKAVKPEPERRSIGIGEVAEKAYAKAAGKTLKPKDPQAAQLKVAEETRDLIKRIVDMGPGGMTK